ncbi:hypothetical protein D910_05215 [Dendroctonus ponderosae]|uniref:Uncharacterized protein n=1 Tax=Dendroctonus ponderosae TaxID=77166 RepID=U4UB62_DENPD|nr:hypothetical protein D910_05215 [Dendroctonus ponderosae]
MRHRSLIYTSHVLAWVVSALGSTVLIADNSMSRMIELTTNDPYCNVHTDRGNIRTMLLAADASRIRQMADEEIGKLEEVCQNKEALRRQQGGFIYPGTKWCGPGKQPGVIAEVQSAIQDLSRGCRCQPLGLGLL